jgi:enamine deaminase RidA (YjgF/YER057c/UK114 family)
VDADRRLRDLGIALPAPPQPVASYVPVVVSGGLAFVAGQVAIEAGSPMWTGKVGLDLDVEAGAEAARRCALQALSALRAELGSLDRVSRILNVSVFVASSDGFSDQPRVANGASDVLVEIFGDEGRHARAAVGVAELPLGAPVEVSLVVEVEA